ncbi:MAG TPA: tetratricopeptide repeat protein, partial [Tepidisphaeraceae bacterium]|nr:tetratricopeptide repeat protein [Tepidisphaeraceae bacterium]
LRRKLAAFYTQGKRYDDALALLDAASPERMVRQQIVEILMLKGEFDKAEQTLGGLLTGDGAKDAQLQALMGVVKLNRGQKEAAVARLNEALTLDPRNQAALYARAQIRMRETPPQVDDAMRDLTALRDANPGHVEARVALADTYRQKLQPEAAARELEEVLRRAPGRRDVRVTLCGIYASAKPPLWIDVERHLRQAEELEPQEPMWKRMAAKMLSARNQHEAAALRIRDALAAARTDAERGDLVRDYLDILEAGKNWGQLQAEVDQLFVKAPAVAKDGWWAYVKRAVARKNLNDKAAAMKDFEQAFNIAQEQGNSDVLFGIVDRIGQHMGADSAIARVQALVATTKGTEQLRWKTVLGYLMFTANDAKGAVATVEDVAGRLNEMAPKDKLTAMTVSGTVYMLAGEHEKAQRMYEALLKQRPDDIAALNNMACLLAEHTKPVDLTKALEYATRANDVLAKGGRSDAAILDTMGWVLVLIGGPSLDRGIEQLDRAVKLGDLPESHYHLAEAFMRKKFPEEAKKSLTRADELVREKLEKNPTDANLKALKVKVDAALLQVGQAVIDAGRPTGAAAAPQR